MSETAGMRNPAPMRHIFDRILKYSFITGVLIMLALCSRGPTDGGGIRKAPESPEMQQTRSINLLLFAYSNDHHGQYPDGESSTQVFQKLIDEDYVNDSAVFYLPLPGKTKPLSGQKLRPENVSFDVTSGVDSTSPDQLPIVFTTGYKVAYIPGGSASLILLFGSPVYSERRTWKQWWNNEERPLTPSSGIAVTYKSNSARFMKLENRANSDPSIPNFISPDFKPDGKTYRQLTPDGVLP